MPFPIIPILAIGGIIGGLFTLDWYYSKSKVERAEADRIAMEWFGRTFQELSRSRQHQIRDFMDENFT
ncbi:MAG: hypothetical protein AAFN93_27885 [Bacteroidota bacterium]